jgi:hypothetical protein
VPPPARNPVTRDDLRALRVEVTDIDELLRNAREQLASLRGQVRIIIALLVANGVLNVALTIHGH